MGTTSIEWATKSWNPVTGCTPISEGCEHCYAKRMSARMAGRCGYPKDESFRVTFHQDKLLEPFKWRKPQRVFVGSMTDLFHSDITDRQRDWIFQIIGLLPQHTFMVLTKRPAEMLRYFFGDRLQEEEGYTNGIIADMCSDRYWRYQTDLMNIKYLRPTYPDGWQWPLPNLWLGVTAENQARADERIPILLQIPAAVRFVSVEPMLGPVNFMQNNDVRGVQFHDYSLGPWLQDIADNRVGAPGVTWKQIDENHKVLVPKIYRKLNWVIAGPETGPHARPCKREWVAGLYEQCRAAGVPFFDKRDVLKKGIQEWPK
jgi:protein gp37